MYSKSKLQAQPRPAAGGGERGTFSGLTPPPGYDGSRFRRRSDGRDDAFPLYGESIVREPPGEKPAEAESAAQAVCDITPDGREEKKLPVIPFLQNIGKEELLIIALIIILAGERERCTSDTILLLGLLLCIG